MKRQIPETSQIPLDLLIIGGGIHGAAMAYFGSLNNLNVGLVEKDDFCTHTSANSQKVIHGGLRYLQSLDIKRVMESIRENQRFYALFPHLVQPMPCVMPLSGWGAKSREVLGTAFLFYRFLQKLACRKNTMFHPDKTPRLLSSQKIMEMFPHLQVEHLRGGALWYDGLCVEPERVVISLLKSAAGRGAAIANHARVNQITRTNPDTLSVLIDDRLTGNKHEIKTYKTVLCTGPWFKQDWGLGPVPTELNKLTLIAGLNIITDRICDINASIALKSRKKKSRLLFIVPWKNNSISGTIWEDGDDFPFRHHTFKPEVGEQLSKDLQSCYPVFKTALPVLKYHYGYVPGNRDKNREPAGRLLSSYLLIDREKEKSGDVLQVISVKFTTAFDVALKALKKLFPDRHFKDKITSDSLPIGSPAEVPKTYLESMINKYGGRVSSDTITLLFSLIGTELPRVLDEYVFPAINEEESITEYNIVLKNMTRYFIREEAVFSLKDLIFRRFFPGRVEDIKKEDLSIIASEMASILHWTSDHLHEEISRFNRK